MIQERRPVPGICILFLRGSVLSHRTGALSPASLRCNHRTM